MSTRLSGKVVLVTGATGGIGEAAAERFVREGAKVVLVDLAEAPLKALAERLGDAASHVVADVADEAVMTGVVEDAAGRLGRIDGAVLNAGIEGRVAPLEEQSLADFDRVMAVNVRGVFLGLKALFPVMRRQGGGSVVITSSIAGTRGSANLAPYSTSKHAVVGLMRTAALEGAAAGIRINTVNPGPIETRMMRSIEAGRNPAAAREAKAAATASIPMKRYGEPEDVAATMLFLLSDDAAYCSGGIYMVDGGAGAGIAMR